MLQSPQPSVTCSVPPGPTAAINSPTPGLVGVGTNGDNILGGGAFGASPPGATHLPAAGGGHHPHLPHSEHIMAAAAAAAAAGMHHPHHGHHPHLHPHFQGPIEPPRPRFLFRMPRVVPNQKEKYESDELMKRHSREGEVTTILLCTRITTFCSSSIWPQVFFRPFFLRDDVANWGRYALALAVFDRSKPQKKLSHLCRLFVANMLVS